MSNTNTIQTDIVINGDCMQVLKDYRDNFFDCIVSDVPYKICTSGAGSTCIAAKELNRHFVGIEINKKYADIAKVRLNNIALKRNKNEQLNLFK